LSLRFNSCMPALTSPQKITFAEMRASIMHEFVSKGM
jgi:hypothetical protein